MIRNFDDVFARIKELPKKKVAVAAAEDEPVLEAIHHCRARGIADAVLVGDEEKIRAIAKGLDIDLSGLEIRNEKEPAKAALICAELVSTGQADMMMKGMIDTKNFLRAVLNKEVGLRTGALITHVGVFDVKGYDRLLFITDAAFTMYPTLEQKKSILENAVQLAHALGNENPKVAPICAVEVVNPDMPATLDAQALTQMNQAGEIKGCTVYGPLAFDNAIDAEAARHKKIDHPVAGHADIFLMANIEAGNGVFKAITYTSSGERHGGILMGAAAPVIVTSRADSFEAKVNSIALAALAAQGGK
ncbi:phosphotransbutyrylase [Clostridiaceae bacterium JG1575]|nr:phosphotransbutyrylase [Clostridiaceae bacterium JG1575]